MTLILEWTTRKKACHRNQTNSTWAAWHMDRMKKITSTRKGTKYQNGGLANTISAHHYAMRWLFSPKSLDMCLPSYSACKWGRTITAGGNVAPSVIEALVLMSNRVFR